MRGSLYRGYVAASGPEGQATYSFSFARGASFGWARAGAKQAAIAERETRAVRCPRGDIRTSEAGPLSVNALSASVKAQRVRLPSRCREAPLATKHFITRNHATKSRVTWSNFRWVRLKKAPKVSNQSACRSWRIANSSANHPRPRSANCRGASGDSRNERDRVVAPLSSPKRQ